MAKKLFVVLPILAAFLFMDFISPVYSAPDNSSTEIVAVLPNYDSGQLIIRGSGLSDVDAPIIELGGFLLPITSWSDTEITAELDPSNYALGEYLLVVDPNFKRSKKVQTMISLGAEGPDNPGWYSAYTNGLRVPANDQIEIIVRCHDDDFAIHAQEWVGDPERTPLGSINEFWSYSTVAVNETSSAQNVTVLLSCLDFSRPFHQGEYEEAICVENQYRPGQYVCEIPAH